MRKLILLCAVLFVAASSWAVPAKRVVKTVQQSDGSSLTIQLQGDETFHFYTTLDGKPVRQDANGDWVADTRDVYQLWQTSNAKRAQQRERLAKKAQQRAKARKVAAKTDEAVKTYKGLLILVNFKDVQMKPTSTNEVYNQMLNGIGNPYGVNYGSVREYFRAQSYGQFDIEFDVVGPVTVSQNMSYYGANDSSGDDLRPGNMIKEACQLADEYVNFADYDWDGDGEVENIYVTYAGYSEAAGGAKNTIWPHQWSISDATGSVLRLDGVKVDTYATGSELYGTSGSTIDGIGTMCHEYSHCLGLPDFYDTSSNGSNFGMDAWSIMDYGCYSGDGYCPAGYTAYERMYCGWLEPVKLESATRINGMKNIEENAEAYIIYNDANKNEYYLLANHQLVGWDESAYGHGMMVLHVDYSQSAWNNNTVNNTSSRQRMTIIPADGVYSTSKSYSSSQKGLAGDLWPGATGNSNLTDTTTPAAKLYNANTDGQKLMHKPIENISESNGLISFDFMADGIAKLETPVIDESAILSTANSISISWSPVEGAVSYNLSCKEETAEEYPDILNALCIYEDFEKVVDGMETDGNTDISASLDSYMSMPGWTGSKVYRSYYGVKLGSSKAGGQLTSPLVSSTTSKLTLLMYVYDWFNANYVTDGATPTVSILSATGTVVDSQVIQPDYENYIIVSFDNVPSEFKLQFSTTAKKRCYICYLLGFDGNYSEDDILSLFDESDSDDEEEYYVRPKFSAPRSIIRKAADAQFSTEATSYIFSELNVGTIYTIRVQAVDADGRTSEWSEAVSVVTTDADAIISTEVQTQSLNNVWYDLSGRQLRSSMPGRGIYVRNGHKVVLQ